MMQQFGNILNEEDLKVQLAMFKNKYKVSTTADAVHVLREMPPEVRGLFDQVETLVRLLMVVPISSAEAECSFSGLCRLKTWLPYMYCDFSGFPESFHNIIVGERSNFFAILHRKM